MLIPWGFGQWPRVFPTALALISGICIFWSQAFFSNVKSFEKEVGEVSKDDDALLGQKVRAALVAGCEKRFSDTSLCEKMIKDKKPKQEEAAQVAENSPPPTPKKTEGIKDPKRLIQLTLFMGQLSKDFDKWPEDVKATTEYAEMRAEIARIKKRNSRIGLAQGLTTRSSANLFYLTRASFTHVGYLHLFGNLFFLLMFGLWVEQRVGFILTLMTFFAGGVVGIATQLVMNPESPVLGASAGVNAVMGSFFVYFMHFEFQFVFTLAGLYFRRLWTPILWAFPVLYLAADFVGALGASGSNVAHWAHLGGLAIGIVMALVMNRFLPLAPGLMFFQEEKPLRSLQKSNDPEEIWGAFHNLVRWNSQNWLGIELFLNRMRELHLIFGDKKRHQEIDRHVSALVSHTFRRGAADDMLRVLSLLPQGWDSRKWLKGIPLSQLLFLADRTAQEARYGLALMLYTSALERTEGQKKRLIQNAIQKIHEINPILTPERKVL